MRPMRPAPLHKAPDLEAEDLTGEQQTAPPAPAAGKDVNLCARVSPELRDQVKMRALQERRSVQDLVVEAVTRYLEESPQR